MHFRILLCCSHYIIISFNRIIVTSHIQCLPNVFHFNISISLNYFNKRKIIFFLIFIRAARTDITFFTVDY